MAEVEARVAAATDGERAALVTRRMDLRASVRAEKLGEVAAEFDGVNSIQRAVEVGSVDAIIEPGQLRPHIIAAIDGGLSVGSPIVPN